MVDPWPLPCVEHALDRALIRRWPVGRRCGAHADGGAGRLLQQAWHLGGVAFILLFRVGEGQVQSMGPVFPLETRALGGLGLSAEQMGGLRHFRDPGLIGGSILGGTFAAKMGLQRALFWLILANERAQPQLLVPPAYQPTDLSLITAMLSFEMFGYGFGFVLTPLHDAGGGARAFPDRALRAGHGRDGLGFQLSTMVGGKIHAALGYHADFFIWGFAGCHSCAGHVAGGESQAAVGRSGRSRRRGAVRSACAGNGRLSARPRPRQAVTGKRAMHSTRAAWLVAGSGAGGGLASGCPGRRESSAGLAGGVSSWGRP